MCATATPFDMSFTILYNVLCFYIKVRQVSEIFPYEVQFSFNCPKRQHTVMKFVLPLRIHNKYIDLTSKSFIDASTFAII